MSCCLDHSFKSTYQWQKSKNFKTRINLLLVPCCHYTGLNLDQLLMWWWRRSVNQMDTGLFFPVSFSLMFVYHFPMKAGKKSHWKWTGFKIHTLSLPPKDILKAKACIAAYNWFFQVKLLSIYSLRWSKWRFEYSTYWQLEADCYSTKMTLMSWFWF